MERTQRRIVIALSSSVEEFADEREKLGAFVEHLNRIIYRRRGVALDWRVCEDEGRSIRYEPRQDEFDGDIRECRFLFVLIGKRFGEFTEHEFYLALELFEASKDHPDAKQRGIPKIYPFFTSIPEEEREPRAREFRRKVETEIHGGQLTTRFPAEQLDTLKLYILEEFGRDPLLWGAVTVEDGQARMDGQPVMSVEKVPVYANHKNLHRLRRERAALDKDFAELTILYHAGNQEAGVERIRVSRRRRELTDKIHEIEEETFKMFQLLAELAKERQTERTEAAARLLSNGDYEQARAVLKSIRDEEIVTDWKRARKIADSSLEAVRGLIRENRLRIQAIEADGVTIANLAELRECYQTSADAAQTYHMEPEAVYDYAVFLRNEHNYPRAIELCEWLEVEYRQQRDTPSETWAQLYNLLGACHTENKNFRRGETYFRDALARYRALAESAPKTYIPDVAMICNNLAELLRNAGRYRDAEPLFHEALERYRALTTAYPDAFHEDMAATCNNLAILLSDTGRHEEAEPLYREALDIRRNLAEAYPDAFHKDVATTCNNLANLLSDTGREEEAESLYREALDIRRNLAEAYPDAFKQYVADTCNNLAGLFYQTDRNGEAEPLFREALDIRRALAEAYPDAFNQYVATTCNNLANLLSDTGRDEEAETLYREAQDIRRALADAYPDAFNPVLAATCFNLGLFELQSKNDPTAAKKYFEEALALYERYPYLAEKAAQTRAILEFLEEHF